MRETKEATTFLIGTQSTTGMTHLTTAAGKPRCGMARATRYGLFVRGERGTIDDIKCKRCRDIAKREIEK